MSNQSVPTITRELVDQSSAETPSCGNLECSLDIEMVMAMAPSASILVYEGPYNNDCFTNDPPLDVVAKIADDNLASVVSSSWYWYGWTDTNVTTIFEQFATQGQTYFQCSGDVGAFTSDDPYTVPFQPSCESQLMTLVGATQLTTSGSTGTAVGSYVSETTWNQSPGAAATKTPVVNAVSSGGYCDNPSPLAIPTYQVPFVNAQNSASSFTEIFPTSPWWVITYLPFGIMENMVVPKAQVLPRLYGRGSWPLRIKKQTVWGNPPWATLTPFCTILVRMRPPMRVILMIFRTAANNNYWVTNTNIYKRSLVTTFVRDRESPKCNIINDLVQISRPTATATTTLTNTFAITR